MNVEIVVTGFVGLMLSAGLGYFLGWLRGHNVGTARASAAYEAWARRRMMRDA